MPEPLSPERIVEIRERADSATPGPWGIGNGTEIALDAVQTGPGCFSYTVKLASVVEDDDRQDDVYYLNAATQPRAVASAEDDALFIAHSRQDMDDLLAEVDRLRTPPPPGELRGLDAMCAALHAATETDPVVKEVAWRTFALIRAHREQSAEVDRRLPIAEVEQFLLAERDEHAPDSIWWQAVDSALAAFRARYGSADLGGEPL